MSELTLTLKQRLTHRLDVSSLTPERLTGKSLKDIKALSLPYGMTTVTTGSLFEVAGKTGNTVAFVRSCDKLDGIGAGMQQGAITVRGPCGHFLGRELKGGTIEVKGDVGDWCGSGMTAGQIEVQGNAGDGVGGAYPGDQTGMKGGVILVTGNAGQRVAERMRRGLIVVIGDCGDFAGTNMLAGTLVVLGDTGRYPGFAMKRGTIVLGTPPSSPLASFNNCGVYELGFLHLVFQHISSLSARFKFFQEYGTYVERLAGDLAGAGRGEILVLQ